MGKPGETDSPEILGLNSVTLTVNGGRDKITLRPLSLFDKAEARKMDFTNEDDLTDWAIWRAAVRGGYDGDQESLLKLIEGDEGLSKYRGQIIPRNASYEPWYHRADFRLLQDFSIPGLEGHKLQFSWDIQNFLNLFNSSWGKYQYVYYRSCC